MSDENELTEEEKESDDFLRSMRVPFFCPVCTCPMKGDKSSSSYYQHGVCVNCKIEFIEGREERWKSGWRPSQEQIRSMIERY